MIEDLDEFFDDFGVDAEFGDRTFPVLTGSPVGSVSQSGVSAWDQAFEVRAKTADLTGVTENVEITVTGTRYRVLYRADDSTGISALHLRALS